MLVFLRKNQARFPRVPDIFVDSFSASIEYRLLNNPLSTFVQRTTFNFGELAQAIKGKI